MNWPCSQFSTTATVTCSTSTEKAWWELSCDAWRNKFYFQTFPTSSLHTRSNQNWRWSSSGKYRTWRPVYKTDLRDINMCWKISGEMTRMMATQYACVFCHTLGMLHCFYTSHMQLVYQLISSTVVMLLTILTVHCGYMGCSKTRQYTLKVTPFGLLNQHIFLIGFSNQSISY